MSATGRPEGSNARATFTIYGSVADKLNLSLDECSNILGVDRLTYERWQADPAGIKLSDNHIVRSSELLDVYGGLLKIFGDCEVASLWLRRSSGAFGDKPPLDALQSADVMRFRSVLDYIKGILTPCGFTCQN